MTQLSRADCIYINRIPIKVFGSGNFGCKKTTRTFRFILTIISAVTTSHKFVVCVYVYSWVANTLGGVVEWGKWFSVQFIYKWDRKPIRSVVLILNIAITRPTPFLMYFRVICKNQKITFTKPVFLLKGVGQYK